MSAEAQNAAVFDVDEARVRAARARALQGGPGRRGLLGRLVRPLQAADAGARAGRRGSRGQGGAGQGRRREEPAAPGGVPRPGHPVGEGVQGRARGRRSSPVRSRPPRWSASSTRSCPPRRTSSWPQRRRAEPPPRPRARPAPREPRACELGKLLFRRGETDEATELLSGAPGDFVADGLLARAAPGRRRAARGGIRGLGRGRPGRCARAPAGGPPAGAPTRSAGT